ncbi:hypothetical protein E8E13_003478 [Curvularia kusanoi]|uniref:Uncharacterized protein n=1 Tax=Curvularia kusanoi TaxID=90978 RepID=A0A9P4TJ76_CURKU|nr:hypothetical protein E8E13_003478 [Curvularia kusanoi]
MPDSDSDSDYSLIDFPHTDSGGGDSGHASSRNGPDVPPLGEDFEFLSIYEVKGNVDSQNMRKPDEGKEGAGGEKARGLSHAERLPLDVDTTAISKPFKQAIEVLKQFEMTQGMSEKKPRDTAGYKAIDPLHLDMFARPPVGKTILRKGAMVREGLSQHTRDSLKKGFEESTKNGVSANNPRPSDMVRNSGIRPPRVAISRSSVAPRGTDTANTRDISINPDYPVNMQAHPERGFAAHLRIPKRASGRNEEDADAKKAGVEASNAKAEPISERETSDVPATVRRTETPKSPVLPHCIWSEQKQQWVASDNYISPEVATEMDLHIKNMASTFVRSPELRDRFKATVSSELQELGQLQHSCFGCSSSGHRDLCSNERTDRTACDECVRLRRPCCRLWVDPRDLAGRSFAYGLLPLPKELREVDDHRELGYYVRSTMKKH